MRHSLSRVLTPSLAAVLLAVPVSLSAQVHLLVAGGLSEPTGSFSKVVGSGYHGRLGLQVGAPAIPLSVRVEGEVDRFPASGSAAGHATIMDGTASAVLSLGGVGISPYVLAGLGEYHTSFGGGLAGATSTDMGYHAGVGLSIGVLGFGGFVEARFVSVSAPRGAIHYVPVTIGLRF